jgi:arylsulfatase
MMSGGCDRGTMMRTVFAAAAIALATQCWAQPSAEPSTSLPTPVWPKSPDAPGGAPNVLLVMTDDVGFGASSTFGGPIPTPSFDRLAAEGLRYSRFHTTAICSPTRASLLTGRNPHAVGMGNATNVPTGYPGYHSVIPKSAGSIARVLSDAGYGTAMFGKAHITPEWESGPAGPFDRWPTGLGFQHFYGFLNADTSMFEPALVSDQSFVDPPVGPDYHFDRDIADKAIGWIETQKSVRPDRPLFVYLATGAAHAPHHAPADWLGRFRGRFDQGWDRMRAESFARQKAAGVIPANAKLTPRPAMLPAWTSLSADERRLAARLMEAHAAALAFADEQIGRVVAAMRAANGAENTLVIYIQGDNGASAEGGRTGLIAEQSQINGLKENLPEQLGRIDAIGTADAYNTYPAAWGWAMNTPFQWFKRVGSHFGGTRNGMVIAWPGHIADPGRVRSQFHHVADVMPTILEAAGVPMPAAIAGVAQLPLDGISMTYSFRPGQPSRRRMQIFEMMESMALYEDGWMLSSTPVVIPWAPAESPRVALADRGWELYDLDHDFSQARDLAARKPERLAKMKARYWALAEAGNVLPIHGLTEGREGMPDPAAGRHIFVYRAGQARIPEYAGAPSVAGRSFAIDAEIGIAAATSDGVIVAQGGRFGGYAFYLKEGRPSFHYNAIGNRQYRISADRPLPAGRHRLSVRFDIDRPAPRAGGTVTLYANGKEIARGRVETSLRRISHTEGLDIGRDAVSPVSDEYTVAESAFRGKLESVTVTLDPG